MTFHTSQLVGACAALIVACAVPIDAGAGPSDASCAELKSVQSALESGDISSAEAAYQTASSNAECAAESHAWFGDAIAKAKYNEAIKFGVPNEAAMTAVLAYGRPWQALATLGDMAMEKRDYGAAARRYQEALVEISDPQRTPDVPAADVVLGLTKKAEQAGLLSPTYVATPRSRDGSNAGLAAGEIRGIAIGVVAFPVQFEFDSTDFTSAGAAAAEDMAGFLKNVKSSIKVRLVGHTDPRGEPDYNLSLSQRRAAALAAYLKAHGVSLSISTEGKGESTPYAPDDPAKYSEEELFQMDRRVELRREK